MPSDPAASHPAAPEPSTSTSRVLRSLILPAYLPGFLQAIGTQAITPLLPLFALDLGFSYSQAAALAPRPCS